MVYIYGVLLHITTAADRIKLNYRIIEVDPILVEAVGLTSRVVAFGLQNVGFWLSLVGV